VNKYLFSQFFIVSGYFTGKNILKKEKNAMNNIYSFAHIWF